MPTKGGQHLCRWLRAILVDLPNGASIADSEHFQDALDGLEFFIPQVLRGIYPEWEYESLDGFYPLVARKTREREAEVFGLCILITDQTLTPIHVCLQVSPSADEISWLECKLGERGENGMVRWPLTPSSTTTKLLHALEGREEAIEWVYKVTFGDRRPVFGNCEGKLIILAEDEEHLDDFREYMQ